MKKNYISITLVYALIATLAGACKKSEEKLTEENCAQITQVKITGAKAGYYTGDSISLGTSLLPNALYIWRQTNAPNDIGNSPTIYINSCTKYDEGWYYLIVSNADCATHYDSVYIKVINKPVTASCSPTNNSVSFSAIPSVSFPSVSWGMDPSYGLMNLSGHPTAGYPDLNIYFNPYWNDKEPEDGEYTIGNDLGFSDNDLYTVVMASLYSSIYFQGGPGKVYVSHTGGKLQVTFCTVPLTGTFGSSSYNVTGSGKLTAP